MSVNAQPVQTRMNVALTLTFARPEKPGSNDFEILTSALTNYQAMLLQQVQEATDDDLRPALVQDAITTNGLLCQLLNQGFNEVFNLSFYGVNSQQITPNV